MRATEPLRVGVVGVGAMGQAHARIFSELPRTTLVGVTDRDLAKAEVLRRSGLDSGQVDQVVAGCVTQAGEQSNGMVRRAWLHA